MVITRDFDNDGDRDVATANLNVATPATGAISVSQWNNNGTGTFTLAPTSPETAGTGVTQVGIASADFDGSTFADIVVPNSGTQNPGTATILLNQTQASADLAIDKTDSPDPATVGGQITYTLAVTNNGPSDASSVNATDTLPAGLSFASSPDACSDTGGGVIDCDFGTVANGATENQSFVVNVAAAAAPGVSNTASVDGAEADPTPGNDSDTEATQVDDPVVQPPTSPPSTGGGTPPLQVPKAPKGTCRGKSATLSGTSGPDRLHGGPGPDVIVSGRGEDVVRGGKGNDLICGKRGDDLIFGGAGRDVLAGGMGSDRMYGGADSDRLFGGLGFDALFGGSRDGGPQKPGVIDRCNGGESEDNLRCRDDPSRDADE
jgi:uncharacterized repeat protein (TIGR01451 family)